MKWTSAFCSICIFLCVIFSSKGNVYGQEDVFAEGDLLFSRGQYLEAGIAYERVYYTAEDSRLRVLANLRKSNALKQQGEFARVVNDLQRSLPYAPDDSLRRQLLYEMALCAHLSGGYPQSQSLILQYEANFPDEAFNSALGLLKGLNLVKLKQWDALENYLEEVRLEEQGWEPGDSLQQALQQLLEEDNRPTMRDPEKARLFSTLIPGSGHMYAGEPGAGLLNGFSQLASLGVTILMGFNQLYVSGFVVGLGLFQSFYFGGIRMAGELTEERNTKEMSYYQHKLSALLFEIYQAPPNEP
ncbi:MAG: hypothetical protein RBS53_03200 [Bacteroidales bacterium]|nr:hypothetical protein [Bacteroidales bacterium]NLM92427.1 hypothetical protein [Bacteroidales bacterium]